LQHVFRSIGISNLDWRAGRQRQASPGEHAARLEAIDRAQIVAIAGESPTERAPVLWLRVLKAQRSGAKILQSGDAREARAAAGDAARVALIWDGVDPAVGRSYAQAFADVAELSAYIASEQSNARGAEAMGMLPGGGPGYGTTGAGLDGSAMLESARTGAIAVLSLFGVNPARNASDPAAAREALDKIPFLVVSELFMTETARSAALVLPAKGAFEKSGTTLGLGGELLPVNASLAAPPFVHSDLEMLLGFAEQFDVPVPSPDSLHRTIVALAAKPVSGFGLGNERFVRRDSAAAKPATASNAPILSGGGTWQHDPWLAGMRA